MSASLRSLRVVKAIHTIVWAGFAGCIVAVPLVAWRGHFVGAFVLIAIVFVEVTVLVANGWRCPLTDVAARYTPDRADNFDIYLPVWLARHNKVIFGSLFAAGLIFTVCLWRWRS